MAHGALKRSLARGAKEIPARERLRGWCLLLPPLLSSGETRGPQKTRNDTFPADCRVRPGGGQNGPESSDFHVFTTREGPWGASGNVPEPRGKKFRVFSSPYLVRRCALVLVSC